MFMFIYNAVYNLAYNFMFNEIWAKYADADGTVHGMVEGLTALSEAAHAGQTFGTYCATAAMVALVLIVSCVVVGIIEYAAKRYTKQATIEA